MASKILQNQFAKNWHKRNRFLDFADNRLDDYNLLDVIKPIEKIINTFKPEIIYTHHYGDLNKDHQIVNRAVMTSVRPNQIVFVQKFMLLRFYLALIGQL